MVLPHVCYSAPHHWENTKIVPHSQKSPAQSSKPKSPCTSMHLTYKRSTNVLRDVHCHSSTHRDIILSERGVSAAVARLSCEEERGSVCRSEESLVFARPTMQRRATHTWECMRFTNIEPIFICPSRHPKCVSAYALVCCRSGQASCVCTALTPTALTPVCVMTAYSSVP